MEDVIQRFSNWSASPSGGCAKVDANPPMSKVPKRAATSKAGGRFKNRAEREAAGGISLRLQLAQRVDGISDFVPRAAITGRCRVWRGAETGDIHCAR